MERFRKVVREIMANTKKTVKKESKLMLLMDEVTKLIREKKRQEKERVEQVALLFKQGLAKRKEAEEAKKKELKESMQVLEKLKQAHKVTPLV